MSLSYSTRIGVGLLVSAISGGCASDDTMVFCLPCESSATLQWQPIPITDYVGVHVSVGSEVWECEMSWDASALLLSETCSSLEDVFVIVRSNALEPQEAPVLAGFTIFIDETQRHVSVEISQADTTVGAVADLTSRLTVHACGGECQQGTIPVVLTQD